MAVGRAININWVVERVPMIIYFECMKNKMLLSLIYLPKVTGHLLHNVILISFEMNIQQETSSIYELATLQTMGNGRPKDSLVTPAEQIFKMMCFKQFPR